MVNVNGIELRDHQHEAAVKLIEYWQSGGGNPVINAATGTGKSILISNICRHILQVDAAARIGVLTTSKELVKQDYEALHALMPFAPAGIVMSGLNRKDYDSQIVVGSVQTLYRAINKTGGFHILLVDECHLAPGKDKENSMYQKLFKANRGIVPNFKIVGLTATPWRAGFGPIYGWEKAIFDDVIYEIGIGEAIEKGYLVPPVTQVMDHRMDTSHLKVSRATGDYTDRDLAEIADDDAINIPAVQETIKALTSGGRNSAVVFCASIDHAETVRDLFRKFGEHAECVHGQLKRAERDRVIDGFRAGEYRVITNCNVLTIGFDYPALDLVTVLRPTNSTALWLQVVGRGLRTSPGKEDCLVLDFTDNSTTHGPIDLIKPPKPPAPKVPREDVGTLKDCPECMKMLPVQTRVCPGCGFEFEFEDNPTAINEDASAAPLLSTQAVKPSMFPIDSLFAAIHQKFGKPDSLRIDFMHNYKIRASTWLALGGFGGARYHAVSGWTDLGGALPAPTSAKEGLERIGELRTPDAILCKRDGKYERVVGYRFAKDQDQGEKVA